MNLGQRITDLLVVLKLIYPAYTTCFYAYIQIMIFDLLESCVEYGVLVCTGRSELILFYSYILNNCSVIIYHTKYSILSVLWTLYLKQFQMVKFAHTHTHSQIYHTFYYSTCMHVHVHSFIHTYVRTYYIHTRIVQWAGWNAMFPASHLHPSSPYTLYTRYRDFHRLPQTIYYTTGSSQLTAAWTLKTNQP